MEIALIISTLIAIVGALTVLTNIIVQVLKKATWDKLPTNLLAIIVATDTIWRFLVYCIRILNICT